jgi:hypothetical protein
MAPQKFLDTSNVLHGAAGAVIRTRTPLYAIAIRGDDDFERYAVKDSAEETVAQIAAPRRLSRVKHTQQPEKQQHKKHGADHATAAGWAIAPMSIIATAAAEDQHEDDDYDQQGHRCLLHGCVIS